MKRITFVLIASLSLIPTLRASAASPATNLTFNISGPTMTPLASPWTAYFGTHYASSPGLAGVSWNTVRSYGGTHVGIYDAGSPSAPARKGPFTGNEIRVGLDNFHAARGGRTAAQLIPDLIQHRATAIYLMSNIVSPGLKPFDKDLAYWAVRQIHEKYPEASRWIVWQMGNEVVSGHFDPKEVWQKGAPQKKAAQKEDNFFGYDLKWKEDFYVNDYLAPAIEAVERASRDLYGDPLQIQIALGSMNPYNRQNLEFLKNVMGRTFDGKRAPTLKNEPVWKHIDLLTVHYMTGSPRTIETLQQYHDDYLKTGKVKGIWITEDHGRAGRGPVTILDRGLRFLSWVAHNHLTAEQARLCWWGEGEREPGGMGREATELLGRFLRDRPLFFARQQLAAADVYVLSDAIGDGVERVLTAIVPHRDGILPVGGLRLELPAGGVQKPWTAEVIQYSAARPAERLASKPVRESSTLTIRLDRSVQEPLLVTFQPATP